MSNSLVDMLTKRYTADTVPPCKICGAELTIASVGNGDTVWACDSWDQNADVLIAKPDRNIADEHYDRSRWRQRRCGDSDVLQLIAQYNKLVMALENIVQVPGNLSDDVLEAASGSNESVSRGIKVTTMRAIAKLALHNA